MKTTIRRVARKPAPEPEQTQAGTTVVRRARRPSSEPTEAPAAESKTTVRRVARPAAKTAPPVAPTVEEPKMSGPDYPAIILRYKEAATTPKKAIRAHCIECMGGMMAEVNRCTSHDCALYPFRLGTNPFHALAKGNRKEKDDE